MIDDDSFWNTIKKLSQIIEQLGSFTDLVQQDKPTLSVVYSKWCLVRHSIKTQFKEPEFAFVNEILENRAEHFTAPIFRLAFHLDPANVTIAPPSSIFR